MPEVICTTVYQFPELSDMRDMYVDEAQRQMYILNENKVYRITF